MIKLTLPLQRTRVWRLRLQYRLPSEPASTAPSQEVHSELPFPLVETEHHSYTLWKNGRQATYSVVQFLATLCTLLHNVITPLRY